MALNISSLNSTSSLSKIRNESVKGNTDFSIENDPIVEGIKKNVKDPIDKEEDLLLWNELKTWVTPKDYSYEGFKKLKEGLVSFPPATAPGKVRKQYREYMEKLPKAVRDEMQNILLFTYGEFARNDGINSSDWKQVIKAMKKNLGKVGPLDADFAFINRCLDDFSDYDKETKEDESVRQILI